MSLKLPGIIKFIGVCRFPDNGSRVVSPRESLIKATAKHTPTVCCPWDNRGLAIGGRGSGMHKSLFRQLL